MEAFPEARSEGGRGERRRLTIIGAPSSIGIRPYEEGGEARRLDRAPGVLRELALAERLGAEDMGDVTPPAYRDYTRRAGGVRNEREVADYSRALAERVERVVNDGRLTLVVGGDCSIVLGSLLGAGRRAGRIGLAYIDAHADFASPEESLTGSAASMCLALAVGRGDSPLARLAGAAPLVRPEDVVLMGRRDADRPYAFQRALRASGVLDLPDAVLRESGAAALASTALTRLGRADLRGFWVHVDADVLDPRVMPAVDSPEPGGPGVDELAELVAALLEHPRALGLQLTIYDPALDPARVHGSRLVGLLERILAGVAGGMPS